VAESSCLVSTVGDPSLTSHKMQNQMAGDEADHLAMQGPVMPCSREAAWLCGDIMVSQQAGLPSRAVRGSFSMTGFFGLGARIAEGQARDLRTHACSWRSRSRRLGEVWRVLVLLMLVLVYRRLKAGEG
jgi:hypothetical protein